jgi:hypothetical protein
MEYYALLQHDKQVYLSLFILSLFVPGTTPLNTPVFGDPVEYLLLQSSLCLSCHCSPPPFHSDGEGEEEETAYPAAAAVGGNSCSAPVVPRRPPSSDNDGEGSRRRGEGRPLAEAHRRIRAQLQRSTGSNCFLVIFPKM